MYILNNSKQNTTSLDFKTIIGGITQHHGIESGDLFRGHILRVD